MAYRKAAYHSLSNQVPFETVGYVTGNIVKELTGQFDCSADKKNPQFAYELGVLSDIQVGEAMVNNKDMTTAWDATHNASIREQKKTDR